MILLVYLYECLAPICTTKFTHRITIAQAKDKNVIIVGLGFETYKKSNANIASSSANFLNCLVLVLFAQVVPLLISSEWFPWTIEVSIEEYHYLDHRVNTISFTHPLPSFTQKRLTSSSRSEKRQISKTQQIRFLFQQCPRLTCACPLFLNWVSPNFTSCAVLDHWGVYRWVTVTFLLYVNLAPYFWHHVVHLPLVLCCSIEHSTATMTFSLQSIILKFHYASRERFRFTVCVGNSARKRRHWIRNGTSRAVDFVSRCSSAACTKPFSIFPDKNNIVLPKQCNLGI